MRATIEIAALLPNKFLADKGPRLGKLCDIVGTFYILHSISRPFDY